MKQETKRKIKNKAERFFRYFAVYAVLPILCGAMVGLLVMLHSVGREEVETIAAQWGEKTLFLATGANAEEGSSGGFYFLSADLPFLLETNARTVIGSASWFRPLPEEKEEEKAEEPPARTDIVIYDALPANASPIIRCNLSSNSYFNNSTKYQIDIDAARAAAFPSSTDASGEGPLVLVLHTHGTESYFEDKTNLSDFAAGEIESFLLEGETSFRSMDPTKTVVQVGKVFADTLNGLGINTIHCEVMHDAEDFNSAYINSAEAVKQYLAQYPSLQYVIDIHRDAIVRDTTHVKSYTELGGAASAQVMLVVGSDQNGRHPNWLSNLVVATAFKDTMDAKYPSLSRALYIRTARFNQEYLPGAMLLEVGSAANTMAEAETAARCAAQSFAQMLKER